MKNFKVKPTTEKGYQWVVRGRVGANWTRKYFHVKAEAQAYADRKNIECLNQGIEALQLPTALRVMALEAAKLLSPYGKTLRDAALFYKAHLETVSRSRTVAEAVPEFLAHKKNGKKLLSVRYLKDLQDRLSKFSRTFREKIVAEISGREITDWLQSLQVSGVTQDNYHRILSVFFEWAKKEGIADSNPIDALRDPEPLCKAPGIFTPDEAALLLSRSTEELLPYLALGLFCGIRPEEFRKEVNRRIRGTLKREEIALDWSAINWQEKTIVISAELAKTNRKRIIEMPDNLIRWLQPLARPVGEIAPPRFREKLEKLRRDIQWKNWPHDVLRHSFCTYHLALHQNEHKTALLAGHSPQILRAHYDAVASRNSAEAFFSVVPQEPINLVQLSVA